MQNCLSFYFKYKERERDSFFSQKLIFSLLTLNTEDSLDNSIHCVLIILEEMANIKLVT